jgi:hypothetical protein
MDYNIKTNAIYGYHGGEYEEYCILGYCAV